MHPYDAFAAAYAAAGFDDFSRLLVKRFLRRWRRSLPKKALILDAGCGQGAASRELVSAGFTPVGLDRSRSMLERYPFACVQGDLTSLPFKQVFDASVCLYDTVNHLHADRLDTFFGAIAAVLKPGAPFVFDVNSLDGSQLWVSETCEIRKKNVELDVRTEFDERTHRMVNHVRGWIKSEGKVTEFEDTVEEWYHPAPLVEGAFETAGFLLDDSYPLFMDANFPETPSKWVYELRRAPGPKN